MNELVVPLQKIFGIWEGSGEGHYPTIKPFSYRERIEFTPDSFRPLVHYVQRTHILETNEPGHWESGFLRVLDDESLEISNAQNSGRVEVLTGKRIDSSDAVLTIEFQSKHFGNDPRMIQSERTFRITDELFVYEVAMATNTTEEPKLQSHLKAELTRV